MFVPKPHNNIDYSIVFPDIVSSTSSLALLNKIVAMRIANKIPAKLYTEVLPEKFFHPHRIPTVNSLRMWKMRGTIPWLHLDDSINPVLQIACVTRCGGKAKRGIASLVICTHTANYTRRQTHFVIVKDVTGFNSAVCRCSSDRNRTCSSRMTETRTPRGLAVGTGRETGVVARAGARGKEVCSSPSRCVLPPCI